MYDSLLHDLIFDLVPCMIGSKVMVVCVQYKSNQADYFAKRQRFYPFLLYHDLQKVTIPFLSFVKDVDSGCGLFI